MPAIDGAQHRDDDEVEDRDDRRERHHLRQADERGDRDAAVGEALEELVDLADQARRLQRSGRRGRSDTTVTIASATAAEERQLHGRPEVDVDQAQAHLLGAGLAGWTSSRACRLPCSCVSTLFGDLGRGLGCVAAAVSRSMSLVDCALSRPGRALRCGRSRGCDRRRRRGRRRHPWCRGPWRGPRPRQSVPPCRWQEPPRPRRPRRRSDRPRGCPDRRSAWRP